MHGRPDVIEKLNLSHRLQSARRHPNRAPDDVRFGEWRIEYANTAKLSLQVRSNFEYAALAFHFSEKLFARAIGDVLAENNNARVARHFGMHGAIDQIDHRARITRKLSVVLGIEFFGRRIDVRRVDMRQHSFSSR